ncbi:Ftsk gamma domain-containing protein [Lentzea albidocapillata subsp. violacea]|uniref:Ftsk gamma domain-containing protein n=1 Tax=Lentzea albidocapillata subsp. violacea TaxID=128104 RepID=A0A1G9YWJ4_9PSEU|nr:DNA translocase FtsK [Lentzea albidocapillata]SDN13508.1 Ftsk gamma domain-containing protein [Lentzea albidocapillata subsp. violacea]
MTEIDEAQQAIMRKFAMLASLAFSAADLAQRSAARRAAEALRASAERQREAARQIRAQRDLAAVQWSRARDSSLYKDPDLLAQAWASAKVWEQLDPRAAAALKEFNRRFEKAGVDPDAATKARETDDYAAMALLLNRAEERRQQDAAELDNLKRENVDAATAVEVAREEANIERVRAALGEERAEAVIESGGWDVLNTALDEAAERGYSPELLLREMYNSRPLDDRDPDKARDVGVVLHWRVEKHLNTNPDPEPRLSSTAYTAEQDQSDAAGETARAADREDRIRTGVDEHNGSVYSSKESALAFAANLDPTSAQDRESARLMHGQDPDLDRVLAERFQDTRPPWPHADVPPPAPAFDAETITVDPGELYKAGHLVGDTQFGSVSMLQRKMRVSRSDAEQLMDALERCGVVGPAEGNRAREVLIRPGEAETHLAWLRELAVKTPTVAEQIQHDVDDLRVAAAMVTDTQFGSTPMLQRRMQISFAEAERLMDRLQEHGIVGPAQGSAAREVLLQPDEADAALMGLAVDPLPAEDQVEREPVVGRPEPVLVDDRAGEGTSVAEPELLVLIGQVDGDEHVYVTADRAAELIAGMDPHDTTHVTMAETIYGQNQQLDDLLDLRFPGGPGVTADVGQAAAGNDTTIDLDTGRVAGETVREGEVPAHDTDTVIVDVPAAGTYETGSEVAQLAGKSYPYSITAALASSKERLALPAAEAVEPVRPKILQQENLHEQ